MRPSFRACTVKWAMAAGARPRSIAPMARGGGMRRRSIGLVAALALLHVTNARAIDFDPNEVYDLVEPAWRVERAVRLVDARDTPSAAAQILPDGIRLGETQFRQAPPAARSGKSLEAYLASTAAQARPRELLTRGPVRLMRFGFRVVQSGVCRRRRRPRRPPGGKRRGGRPPAALAHQGQGGRGARHRADRGRGRRPTLRRQRHQQAERDARHRRRRAPRSRPPSTISSGHCRPTPTRRRPSRRRSTKKRR